MLRLRPTCHFAVSVRLGQVQQRLWLRIGKIVPVLTRLVRVVPNDYSFSRWKKFLGWQGRVTGTRRESKILKSMQPMKHMFAPETTFETLVSLQTRALGNIQ